MHRLEALLAASALVACTRHPVTLVAGGDVQLGEGASEAQLGALAALLRGGDVRLVNLEGPLTARGTATGLDAQGRPLGGPIRFRAPPAQAAALRGRIDCASLANNHVLDQGAAGRDDTAAALAAQGIAAAWPGHDAELAPAGQRVIVVARELGASFDAAAGDEVVAATRAARGRGAVVVSLHWGREGSLLPTSPQRQLAARLTDGGASVVVGHGPHTVQGIERRGRAVIAYSVGNLAFSCRCTEVRDAYLLWARIESDGGVSEVRAVPIAAGLAGAAPRPAGDAGLRELIVTLSRDLGTRAEPQHDTVRVQPRLAPLSRPTGRQDAIKPRRWPARSASPHR